MATKPEKQAHRRRTRSNTEEARAAAAPPSGTASPPAVLSFLQEFSSAPPWTEKDVARTLNISDAEAKNAVLMLQMAGYIAPAASRDHWTVTEQADAVAGAKDPRFTRASVDKAIAGLLQRVKELNQSRGRPSVTRMIVFGDYLSGRDRLQPAQIGVELELPNTSRSETGSEAHAASERILKDLKARSAALNLRLMEPWMLQRAHRTLV